MDIVDPADRPLPARAGQPRRSRSCARWSLLAAERNFPIVGPQVGQAAEHPGRLGLGAPRDRAGLGLRLQRLLVRPGGRARGARCPDRGRLRRAARPRPREFLERGGLLDRVRIEVGDALEIIDRIGGRVRHRLQRHRQGALPEVLDKAEAALRPGGLFISDNMLWFGTVLDDGAGRGLDARRQGADPPALRVARLPYRVDPDARRRTVSIYGG